MNTKVLICADSFGVTDEQFPGLCWAEKISQLAPDVGVMNLSQSGASNALIQLQLHQGLSLDPDFVIFSFTDADRMELDPRCDSDILKSRGNYYETFAPTSDHGLTPDDIRFCNERNFITNCWLREPAATQMFNRCYFSMFSPNAAILKSYMQIVSCLVLLKSLNIPFAFSLGGLAPDIFRVEYQDVLDQFHITDMITQYNDCKLDINLWHFQDSDSENSPPFHISDAQVHESFAAECLALMRKYRASK